MAKLSLLFLDFSVILTYCVWKYLYECISCYQRKQESKQTWAYNVFVLALFIGFMCLHLGKTWRSFHCPTLPVLQCHFFYPLVGSKTPICPFGLSPRTYKKPTWCYLINKRVSFISPSWLHSRLQDLFCWFFNTLYWLQPYWALCCVLFLLSINGGILMGSFAGKLSHFNEKAAPFTCWQEKLSTEEAEPL